MMGGRERAGAIWALVVGGGTAGHVLPGLAVADALVERGHERSSIVFVGSARGLERDLVPARGYAIELLPGRGIQRRFTLENMGALWGLVRAVVAGIALVRRHRPRVVLSVGGYASVGCVVGAVLHRVPIVVTEQNARAGLASRLAGRFAKACAVPFAETDLPRAEVTGNPVRDEVLAVDRVGGRAAACAALGLPADRTIVAVVTGSLGARRVNEAVLEAVPVWSDRADVAIHHVIGSRDWDELSSRVPASEALVHSVVRYEDRMELVLTAADLLIGRAGGTTVAELSAVGLGGVLVPLPAAPRDHQTANAAALVRAGGAILIPDAELDGDRLVQEVTPLLDDPDRLAAMGRAAAALGHRDAAQRVADLVERSARPS